MMALSPVTHTLQGLLGRWEQAEHRGAPAKGTRPSHPGSQTTPSLGTQQPSVLNLELPALQGAARSPLAVCPGSQHPRLWQSISSHKLPERLWCPQSSPVWMVLISLPKRVDGRWKCPGALLVPHASGGICPSLSSFRVATWDLAGGVSALISLSRQVGAGQGVALGLAGGGCPGHTPHSWQQASPCRLRPRALPLHHSSSLSPIGAAGCQPLSLSGPRAPGWPTRSYVPTAHSCAAP